METIQLAWYSGENSHFPVNLPSTVIKHLRGLNLDLVVLREQDLLLQQRPQIKSDLTRPWIVRFTVGRVVPTSPSACTNGWSRQGHRGSAARSRHEPNAPYTRTRSRRRALRGEGAEEEEKKNTSSCFNSLTLTIYKPKVCCSNLFAPPRCHASHQRREQTSFFVATPFVCLCAAECRRLHYAGGRVGTFSAVRADTCGCGRGGWRLKLSGDFF